MSEDRGISRREAMALVARGVALAGMTGASGLVETRAGERAELRSYRHAFAEVGRYAEQFRREMNAPGMIVALSNREHPLYAAAYGWGDVEARERIKLEQLFEIGSISKSFVAIALLQLVDEGKLDLHKPVGDYLPWLKIDSQFAPITTHHFLTHTAGLPDDPPVFLPDPAARHRAAYAPGEHFHYSNLGFDILGVMLATLDGRPHSESVRRRILEPLHMAETEPLINGTISRRLVRSYFPLYSDRPYPRFGKLTPAPELFMEDAAGSIASTAEDMAIYCAMLGNRGQGGGARIISEENFALMTNPWIATDDLGPNTSYGLMIESREGHTIARHTGGMVSFASAMQINLETGFGAFVSVNAMQGYRPNSVAAYALETLAAAGNGKTSPRPPAANRADKIEKAAEYAGRFVASDGRALEFEDDGQRLFLHYANKRLPVETFGDGFLVQHPDFELYLIRFGRGEEGKGLVTEAFCGPDWFVNDKYSGPRAFETPQEWSAFTGQYRNENSWLGSVRVFTRKGKLWFSDASGSEIEFVQSDPTTFRAADTPFDPEWITFLDLVDGHARHLKFSGQDFWRVQGK